MNKHEIDARLLSKEEMRLISKKKPLKVAMLKVVDEVAWELYQLTKH